ncbi:MAG: cation:proton antiporter [Gammaproteobacteria bacterium]|jgi:Kef-type K+ transport system membrane component KefB
METPQILFQIAIILFTAKVFAEIAARFDIPPIIGELTAGIVLGPTVFGWIAPNDVIKLLAEIGIILLLFEVGLETDVSRLLSAGKRAATVAIGGFVFPFVLGFVLCYYVFELTSLVSLFIGGTLTATSIGITVRILADLGRHQSKEGQIVLGAAVVDDVMGVVLLAILYEFAINGQVSLLNTGKVILFIGVFFLIAPVAAKLLSYVIQHMHDKQETSGIIPVTLVALVLSFAGLAHLIGAPELLGGFAAGVALSRRFFLPFGAAIRFKPEFTRQIEEEMRPIIRITTPIFFVMVGLSLDLTAVNWASPFFWVFSLSVLVLSIVGKLAGAWLIPESRYMRTAIGIAMVPRGEVGLIFAELGKTSEIFNDDIYAAIVIVIAYTTLLAPFWIKSYYRMFGKHLSQEQHDTS